jgi:hypothetical protein
MVPRMPMSRASNAVAPLMIQPSSMRYYRRSSAPRFDVGTSWRLSFLLGRAFDVRSRLRYPPGRFRVADCGEEPAKEREAIPSPEPETGGVWREGVRERGCPSTGRLPAT